MFFNVSTRDGLRQNGGVVRYSYCGKRQSFTWKTPISGVSCHRLFFLLRIQDVNNGYALFCKWRSDWVPSRMIWKTFSRLLPASLSIHEANFHIFIAGSTAGSRIHVIFPLHVAFMGCIWPFRRLVKIGTGRPNFQTTTAIGLYLPGRRGFHR